MYEAALTRLEAAMKPSVMPILKNLLNRKSGTLDCGLPYCWLRHGHYVCVSPGETVAALHLLESGRCANAEPSCVLPVMYSIGDLFPITLPNCGDAFEVWSFLTPAPF